MVCFAMLRRKWDADALRCGRQNLNCNLGYNLKEVAKWWNKGIPAPVEFLTLTTSQQLQNKNYLSLLLSLMSLPKYKT